MDMPETAQGIATRVIPGSASEYNDKQIGITNPDLHRRIEDNYVGEGEISTRTYELNVAGVRSYKTISHTIHDESSTDVEIP